MIIHKDKISVVTVVYNGVSFIEETIRSVLAQTYPNIEYIIIDGGSTDGTLDVIEKYQDHISFWSSEPDKGVYDAMNKGVESASGDWINFMNAGDHFFSENAVSEVFSTNVEEYDVIYGDAEFRLKNISYIAEAGDIVDSNGFMPFSHQAVFVKTDIAKKNKFDLYYKITADTAFFLRLVKEGKLMKHIPVTVCSYDALQGLSADNELKCSAELVDMQIKMNGADPNSPYYKKYIKKALYKHFLRKIIPNTIWINMRERKIKKNNQYRYINAKT